MVTLCDNLYGLFQCQMKLLLPEELKISHYIINNEGRLFQMLDILEKFVRKRSYKSLSMDGTTAISSRQHLINKFNSVRKAYFVLHRLCFHPILLFIDDYQLYSS